MTDQPQPPGPRPEGAPPPAQPPHGSPPAPQGGHPGAPPQGGYGSPPPQNPYGAPPPQNPYTGPPPQNPYGAPPPHNPYGAPPPQNPYGYGYGAPGANPYATAPPQAAGPPVPGTIRFVEANFGRVAGFEARAIAYLIDVAVTLIGLVFVLLGGILLGAGSPRTVTFDNGATTTTGGDGVLVGVGVLFLLVGFAAMFGLWLWNRVFRMGRTGQSVGKRSRGLMLVDARTGQPIGAGNAFLRELVNSLINQVLYLGFLWMLWDPDKQTLGDKALHSAVIHVPDGTSTGWSGPAGQDA